MKIHLGGKRFFAAAVLGAAAVFAITLLVALGGRSVVAGPDAAAPAAAPTPVGHEWSQVEGHGTGTGLWWLGTTADNDLELRVNNARALRLEPNATSPNVIGGHSANYVGGGSLGGTIGGGGWSSQPNIVSGGNYGTVAGGVSNHTSGNQATVSGGGGNSAIDLAATVSGGGGNSAEHIYSTVGGGRVNQADAEYATIGGGGSADGSYADANQVLDNWGTVGGGRHNYAGAGGDGDMTDEPYATVGGGYLNTASNWEATVCGGGGNTASGMYASVGGGLMNNASGDDAAIGGGNSNTASSLHAAVGGGESNTASGIEATIGGGFLNNASGTAATIPGGFYNTAAGAYSFAAGHRARANTQGCFVWADSTEADFACGINDRFVARANGGYELYSKSDLSTYCKLSTGSGTWACSSSSDLKENFTSVDGQEVLASLAEIPITTWNYKAQDASIRHMGPVAQDFYAAFGLGEGDTSISSADPDGVALAAIQGLYVLSQEQATRIQALEEENASLQQRLDDVEARVTALEGGASTSGAATGPLSGLTAGWLVVGGLVVVGLALVQRRRAGGPR